MTAMIAGENDNCVLVQPQFLEGAKNCAYGFINLDNASVIFGQLVWPVSGEESQVVGNERIGVSRGIALRRDAAIQQEFPKA